MCKLVKNQKIDFFLSQFFKSTKMYQSYQITTLCCNTQLDRKVFDKTFLCFIDNLLQLFIDYYSEQMNVFEEHILGFHIENIKKDTKLIYYIKNKTTDYPEFMHNKTLNTLTLFILYIKSTIASGKISFEHIIKTINTENLPKNILFFLKPLSVHYEKIKSEFYTRKYYVIGKTEEIDLLLDKIIVSVHPRLYFDKYSKELLHYFCSIVTQNIFDFLSNIVNLNDKNLEQNLHDYCNIHFHGQISFLMKSEITKTFSPNNELNFYFKCNNMCEIDILNTKGLNVKPIKAMIEYLLFEIISLSGKFAKIQDSSKINIFHLYHTIRTDKELCVLPFVENRNSILQLLEN